MHGQRAVGQRPRIAAARSVSDTISQWRTRTARNHMPGGPGCSVGGPYHPPVWRCHSRKGKQAVMTSQVMAGMFFCVHGQEVCRKRSALKKVVCMASSAAFLMRDIVGGPGSSLRGVYPTPSHIGAPGPPETTCRQGQVTRGGSSSMGKSAGTTACCQRGLVFYGQVTGEKGQRRIKKMYVETTASKQKPDCLGMRKDTRYT